MKAIVIDHYGGAEQLHVRELPTHGHTPTRFLCGFAPRVSIQLTLGGAGGVGHFAVQIAKALGA